MRLCSDQPRKSGETGGAAWTALAAAAVLGCGAAYWVPGWRAAGGWPVPLDDVYIHFGFARSAALGHPLSWIPGNGYSSGGTSLTWPLLLAPAWLLGARGASLAVVAAALSCILIFDLCRSLRSLAAAAGAPVLGWLAPAWVLAVPLLDWSWFSGMETALLGAMLGRAALAAQRAAHATPWARATRQWAAGAWCALAVATRPEVAALVAPLAVVVAHGAGAAPAVPALLRAGGPTAALLVAQALANRAFTGEWAAAGAVRKLWTENPYLAPLEVALEVARNLAVLRAQAFEAALGGRPWSWAMPLLVLAALLSRRTRALSLALAIGALGALLLVSLNATARFQNLRYTAPSLILLLAAASLGAAALWRRGAVGKAAAAMLCAAALLAPARWFVVQTRHFARASANIAGQQVEVARRLAHAEPAYHRVLVGDAGAIPYLSGLSAIDGLGLGGYHGMPFARASVHGVAAVVELLERLPAGERPDVMALYPSWWPGLADVFGRPVDRVRITDNVICAADEKVVYLADWTALETEPERRAGAVDALDIADLVSERAHDYWPPVPHGGWVVGAERRLAGAPRFDGGRVVPEGRAESFRVESGVESGPATLVVRTDVDVDVELEVAVVPGDAPASAPETPGQRLVVPGRDDVAEWREVSVPLARVRGGDRVEVRARRGAWRSFQMWLVR
ncbi:MAG: hypothetical protein WKG00_21060 [Polyangiaceae bacterium]